MVERRCEARKKRQDDARLPRGTLSMSANDPFDESISNLVLHADVVHHRAV
jgi:hypothetical protein